MEGKEQIGVMGCGDGRVIMSYIWDNEFIFGIC